MNTPILSNPKNIRIAIPASEGRLHGHFGGCPEFVFVDADTENLTVIANQTVKAPPHKPGSFPRWLREQGVQVVIAGGIGQRAIDNFAQHQIEVRTGQKDASIETVVSLYLAGLLTGSPTRCTHHEHHEHDHEHHHEHDHEHHQPHQPAGEKPCN